MSELVHIHLQGLWPRSEHPQRMLGRFDEGGELVFAKAPDMDLEWTREPEEAAEAFDRRVCQTILEARGLPPLPGGPSLARLMQPSSPSRSKRLPAEPRHRVPLKRADA